MKGKIILKGQESKSAKYKEGKKIYISSTYCMNDIYLLRYTEQVKKESSCAGTVKRHMHVLVITVLPAKYHIIL